MYELKSSINSLDNKFSTILKRLDDHDKFI